MGLYVKARDGTEQRCLATAGRAQEADEFALEDFQRDVF